MVGRASVGPRENQVLENTVVTLKGGKLTKKDFKNAGCSLLVDENKGQKKVLPVS